MNKEYDYIIIGAGIYGLYSALILMKKNKSVLVVESENEAFSRASWINQARVHNGYHYPRSFSTATKSIKYFERFNNDFKFAINDSYESIYAISKNFSLTSAGNFKNFCSNANIPCAEIRTDKYFLDGSIEAAFKTTEYAFDAKLIRDYLLKELSSSNNIRIKYNDRVVKAEIKNDIYNLSLFSGDIVRAGVVVNATYASSNQIIDMFGFEKFKIKYEICEVILCDVPDWFKRVGITVMDGPFFSLMPFGLGSHSLTSVTFTPHLVGDGDVPVFKCQMHNTNCNAKYFDNCNNCLAKPQTAWPIMNQLTRRYLNSSIDIKYSKSLFSVKPIFKAAELDDSRPTVLKKFRKNPCFYSVLSGKINTIYDLEDYFC